MDKQIEEWKDLTNNFPLASYRIIKGRAFIRIDSVNIKIQKERKKALKEVFDKFDEYYCIKDNKWYLDYKKSKLNVK